MEARVLGPLEVLVDGREVESRIDPNTNKLVATIETGLHPHGVAIGADEVWVAVSRETVEGAGIESSALGG